MKTVKCPMCGLHALMSYKEPRIDTDNHPFVYEEEYCFCPTLALKKDKNAKFVPAKMMNRNLCAYLAAKEAATATHRYLLRTKVTAKSHSEVLEIDTNDLIERGLHDIEVSKVSGFDTVVEAYFEYETAASDDLTAENLACKAFGGIEFPSELFDIYRKDFWIVTKEEIKEKKS